MTPQADRYTSLDVLRGVGILGILAVNAPFFSMPMAAMMDPLVLGPLDETSTSVWAAVRVFFERKFVTLFSLLFGVSILLIAGEERGVADRSRVLKRRLIWLAVIGLIHGAVIWYGDILLTYAIAGAIAALFRNWEPRKLFMLGGVLYLAFAALESLSYWALAFLPAEMLEQSMAWVGAEGARAEIAAYTGDLAQVQAQALQNWSVVVGSAAFFIPTSMGLMLIGMGLFKTGVLTARRGAIFYLLLVVAGAAALAAIGWAVSREVAAGLADPVAQAVRSTLNALLAPAVTLGYVGVVCLLLKTPLKALTRPLAATGQMAFTNYLTQSLIMTGIFYGARGMGLFGTMSHADLALIVGGIWLLQLVWSPLWLAVFRYGPLEWIWRTLSFGRPVPFRR